MGNRIGILKCQDLIIGILNPHKLYQSVKVLDFKRLPLGPLSSSASFSLPQSNSESG